MKKRKSVGTWIGTLCVYWTHYSISPELPGDWTGGTVHVNISNIQQ